LHLYLQTVEIYICLLSSTQVHWKNVVWLQNFITFLLAHFEAKWYKSVFSFIWNRWTWTWQHFITVCCMYHSSSEIKSWVALKSGAKGLILYHILK